MKISKLTQRLQKDRPMTMVSIRIPDDVIEDLKRVAPLLGFSGYQALIKAYIGQGLRASLEQLEGSIEISPLIESLRKWGVKEEVISSVIAETQNTKMAYLQKRSSNETLLAIREEAPDAEPTESDKT
jgi:hypothetical protein